MRPYLFLTALALVSVAAFAQRPVPRPIPRPIFGASYYSGGPFTPLLTTPQISLESVSPNPVGASNATTGLIAGATNSTLSEVVGPTSSEYTIPVWNQGGGAPITGPEVNLFPESIGREGRIVREPMREGHPEEFRGEERARQEKTQEKRGGWTYFSGRDYTTSPATVAPGHKPDHVLTNDDITRENEKNGNVKYDGKSEKIQTPLTQ